MTICLLDGLVGASIDRVRYFVTEYDGPDWWIRTPIGHAVATGVELCSAADTWSVTWAVHDSSYGYLVEDNSPLTERRTADSRVIDATDWPDWRAVLGTPVAAVERIREATAPPDQPAHCAVRLCFPDGNVATIAMGLAGDDGTVEYSFYDLVVFLADGSATTYLTALEHEEHRLPADRLVQTAAATSPVDTATVHTSLAELRHLIQTIAAGSATRATLDSLVESGIYIPDLVLHGLIPPDAATAVSDLADRILGDPDDRTIHHLARHAQQLMPDVAG